ncbi:MAG: hypothetical protein VX899_09060 [Myxococcota bacterium]|nr:hypothetical protein [Myxococcota bacterium]
MSLHPDITIRTADGRPLVAVEVKGIRDTSDAWAAQYRRNLIAHATWPTTLFLLVTPDRVYVWRPSEDSEPSERRPDRSLDAGSFWQELAGDLNREDLRGEAFELLVHSWLSALREQELPDGLRGLGLGEALEMGEVRANAA